MLTLPLNQVVCHNARIILIEFMLVAHEYTVGAQNENIENKNETIEMNRVTPTNAM